MATIILVDWDKSQENEKRAKHAEITLQRWGERQGGAAFVSVDSRFILTDYPYDHKEVKLLRHILNCNHLSYRAIANVDLQHMGETIFAQSLINNKNNNNNKKGARQCDFRQMQHSFPLILSTATRPTRTIIVWVLSWKDRPVPCS